jgi:hypothetical protein
MTYEQKMKNKADFLDTILDKLSTDTTDFLNDDREDIPGLTISYNGYSVCIPMNMPETNEAAQDMLEKCRKIVRECADI